jgi:hypothetical protein
VNALEMHNEFKVGLDKTDSLNVPNFEPEERDLWLNKAQHRFILQRYGGTNPKRESFEETEKRSNDLREVIVNDELSPLPFDSSVNKPNSVFVDLNDTTNTYWFAVNEEAGLVHQDCKIETVENGNLKQSTYYYVKTGSIQVASGVDFFTGNVTYTSYNAGQYFKTIDDPLGDALGTTNDLIASYIDNVQSPLVSVVETAAYTRAEVKPTQHDDYNKMIKDPFNKPTNNQIRRMFYQDKVELITDGTSQIDSYFLRYIKKPSDVSLAAYQANPANGNCELSEHTHREIVELAVSMALENIESRRYQTNLAEVVKQE